MLCVFQEERLVEEILADAIQDESYEDQKQDFVKCSRQDSRVPSRQLFDDGVIAFYCGHDPFHVRMLPPLGVMEESQWQDIFEIVEHAMEIIAADADLSPAAPPRPMHQSREGK